MTSRTVSNQPGGDLRVAAGPGLPGGLILPASELHERFSKSAGPGGQSVNTTDSRVELRYDVRRSTVLSESQRARALRVVEGDELVIVASEHRSQHRNRMAARARLADRVRAVLAPPPVARVPTKPTRGSRRRRVENKRRRGQLKNLRGSVRDP